MPHCSILAYVWKWARVPLISQQGLVVPFLLGLVFVFSLYPPAMCASLPCWVDNLSCLWRAHLLSVEGPLGFFTKATGITVPREGNDSLFKRPQHCAGGWYSMEDVLSSHIGSISIQFHKAPLKLTECYTYMSYFVNCKHPSQGVTIFTLSIFTVMLTVIVIWPQWEWVNFQPSEAVKVPALPLYVTRRTPLIFQSYVCGSNDEIMEWYLWKIRCEVCACAGSYQLVDEPLDKTDTLRATERKYLLGPL